MITGRVVLSDARWRVVAIELPDKHGVLSTEYIIELADPDDVDRLGVQRWRELADKAAWSDWMRAARFFLDELLKTAGETPNATDRNGRR